MSRSALKLVIFRFVYSKFNMFYAKCKVEKTNFIPLLIFVVKNSLKIVILVILGISIVDLQSWPGKLFHYLKKVLFI